LLINVSRSAIGQQKEAKSPVLLYRSYR